MRQAPSVSVLVALLLCLAFAVPAAAADLEKSLDARWRGGWVIVRAALSSNCNGFYTDNDGHGARITGRGDHPFEPGELARVDHLNVKMGGRVDVFLDVAEPILYAHHEGPFTLYDPKSCKVQVKVAGAASGDLAAAEQALATLFELHPEAPEAEASSLWNHRRRDPFPPDYDRTLAEYEAWKATQRNGAVQARMSQAIDEAARTNDRMRNDADYLAGFADGIQRARDHSFGNCESLVETTFYPDVPRGKSGTYKQGYEDGQRLAFDLELLKRLRECFVEAPPA